ncbi:MAG: hypothetical protein A2252_02385 [Elusimicrobia bacterium RIFOXYA2_FULL_39_19]|nr:MAG: hypothetical protein A2252_02385 [Elusimicrobia bacterium RIFOXYA2_FULL_39_19]
MVTARSPIFSFYQWTTGRYPQPLSFILSVDTRTLPAALFFLFTIGQQDATRSPDFPFLSFVVRMLLATLFFLFFANHIIT